MTQCPKREPVKNDESTKCPCESCAAANCLFIKSLPEELGREVKRRRTILTLKKNEVLFREGDEPHGIWTICQGQIKLCKQSPVDGKPFISRIARSGELLGYRAFFAEEPFQGTAQAMMPTCVSFFDRSLINSLVIQNGTAVLSLLQKLACDLGNAEYIATNIAYGGAQKRVVDVLLELQRERRGSSPSALDWGVQIRREDLAQLAGFTVETTVRALKKLERKGVVEMAGRQIRLRAQDELGTLDTRPLID